MDKIGLDKVPQSRFVDDPESDKHKLCQAPFLFCFPRDTFPPLPTPAAIPSPSSPLSPAFALSSSVAAVARISSASTSLLKLATTILRVASGPEAPPAICRRFVRDAETWPTWTPNRATQALSATGWSCVTLVLVAVEMVIASTASVAASWMGGRHEHGCDCGHSLMPVGAERRLLR